MSETAPVHEDDPETPRTPPSAAPPYPPESPGSRERTAMRVPLHVGLLGAGFLVLLIIMAISIWLLGESNRVSDEVGHTLSATNLVGELGLNLRRAESGQRGFLLTGDGAYLDDYNAVVGKVPPVLEKLALLTAASPERQEQIGRLRPLIDAKLEEMERTVQLAIEGEVEAARRMVASDRGLRLMNRITEELTVIGLAERQLLSARLVAAGQTQTQLLVVAMSGVLVIVFLATLSVVAIRRSTQTIVAAHAALRRTNQELERRVSERTADLQEANEEIQRFAYIVGHDLRAPLVNVMGFTAELEALREQLFAGPQDAGPAGDGAEATGDRQSLQEEFDEALRFITSSIAKMDRLIQAILQLSRAGRREFKSEAINLSKLLESITNTFSHRLQQEEAELTIGRLPAVASDRLALDQIFSNLIDNALKYRQSDRAPRIDVEGWETDESVTVRIADNGRGIAERDRERIFELFRRAGTQDRPGEGIGLAHVRMLVRRLGGSITLESKPGQGSTFTIVLPKRWAP